MSVISNQRIPLQPISQLKMRAVEKTKRNYCQTHQQKTLTLYHLHTDKIVTIQRWYRSLLNKRNRRKEKIIINKVRKR